MDNLGLELWCVGVMLRIVHEARQSLVGLVGVDNLGLELCRVGVMLQPLNETSSLA